MDDDSIVKLYWERDEQAIEKTKEKYGNYCYAIAYNVLNNKEDADESVNDTYLNVWNRIPEERPQMFKAFIGKITRNLSLKIWKKKSAIKRGNGQVELALEELEECIPAKSSVENVVEGKALAELVDGFLRELPAEECNIFLCRYWYLDSISDICKRFGYGESKVKMRLMRTRKKLQDRLAKEGVSL